MGNNNSPKSLTQRVDFMKLSKRHWHIVLLCMVGVLIENFNGISIALAMPVIAKQWALNPVKIGVLLSGSSLGLLIGAALFGALSDIIGRKKTFIMTIVVFSVFVLISVFTKNYTQLYITRLLAGIGLGGFIPVGSAYVSEFAPVNVRGRFMGIFSIGNGIGYCFAVVASILFISIENDRWRWVFALGAIAGFIIIPMVSKILPESVRWLLGKKKVNKALETVEELERISYGEITVPHEEAMSMAEMAASTMVVKQAGLKNLFSKDLAKASILAAILWFVSNYTFFGFIQWMPTFLTKNMGYNLASGYTFTLIAALVGTGTPGLAVGYLSDTIGRRMTLTICMLGYAVGGFLFLWFSGWWILPLYWFSSAMASQLYVYTPELFPTFLRGTGLGFASSIGRIAGFVAPVIIGFAVGSYGLSGVITVNGIMLVVGVIFTWLLGKETMTKSV